MDCMWWEYSEEQVNSTGESASREEPGLIPTNRGRRGRRPGIKRINLAQQEYIGNVE